jgi:hypothetical protein
MTRAREGNEHWTKMIRQHMECPAWRALSLPAQAIYPWLKLEWKGPLANNNGKIELSLRQIAEKAGCNVKTAMRAVHDLQRKGWIVVKRPAHLGLAGHARSHQVELTEIACPPNDVPSNLYRQWRPGADFPIAEVRTNNPEGRNGIQKPVPSKGMKRSLKGHEQKKHVPSSGTGRSPKGHEQPLIDPPDVPSKGTSLTTRGSGGSFNQSTTKEVGQ